jgi:hypothetical protein
LAKAAEVAARRVLADASFPLFKAFRDAVATPGSVTTDHSDYVTQTFGGFSKSGRFASKTTLRLSTEDLNRIKKSIREWAQSI